MQEPSVDSINGRIGELYDLLKIFEDERRTSSNPRKKRELQILINQCHAYTHGMQTLVDLLQNCIKAKVSSVQTQSRLNRQNDLIEHMTGSLDLIGEYLVMTIESDDPLKRKRSWSEVNRQLELFKEYFTEFAKIANFQYRPDASSDVIIPQLPEPK